MKDNFLRKQEKSNYADQKHEFPGVAAFWEVTFQFQYYAYTRS